MYYDIKLKISAANKSYCAMKQMLSLKLLSRQTKGRLYAVYIYVS